MDKDYKDSTGNNSLEKDCKNLSETKHLKCNLGHITGFFNRNLGKNDGSFEKDKSNSQD